MAQQPVAPVQQGIKKFKKGETLFKEGDKADSIFAIQSGRVQITIVRPSNKIEIYKTMGTAMVGEAALFGAPKHNFTAEAMTEVTALEIPVAVLKPQIDKLPQMFQLLIKSLSDETKAFSTELKSIKLERENTACPQIYIPRLFSTVNLVSRHLGKKYPDLNKVEIAWGSLKLFGVRMLMESPQRLEGLLQILEKLGYAELIYDKDEEGQTVLSRILITNLQIIDDFAEFFQYNLFKGGVSEVIVYDDIAHKTAEVLVKLSEGMEKDRRGAVRVDFNQVGPVMLEKHNVNFKNTHIELLEKKGLFMKRIANEKEAFLEFDRTEFEKTAHFWGILHEIDKWNQHGRVLTKAEEEKAAKKAKGASAECPDCQTPYVPDAKFCSHCGFKLKAA